MVYGYLLVEKKKQAFAPSVSTKNTVRSRMNGAEILVRALEREECAYIFGVPGEENISVMEALRKSSGRIKFVTVRNEQAAGFMAATCGRLTGRITCALSTLGPGALNLSTAIAYAYLGGFPSLFLTGQKPVRASKQGRFQILNVVEHFQSICKKSHSIVDANLIPTAVRDAVRVALREKPGPAHLELPEDIGDQKLAAPPTFVDVTAVRRSIADDKAISHAVEMLCAASAPILVIGSGANRKKTTAMLTRLVGQLALPFVTTQMGKGVVSEHNPLWMGCGALSANDVCHVAIELADLIVTVGHSPIEKPPFFQKFGANAAPVLHIDFFESEIDPVYAPTYEVVGDIANAIWQITEKLPQRPPSWNHDKIMSLRPHAIRDCSPAQNLEQFPLDPVRVVRDLRAVLDAVDAETSGPGGIVCLDNGMYKLYFARSFQTTKPNGLLLDNALATMGAGVSSAIAAKLCCPDATVVAVCGDGGVMMHGFQELSTALALGLDLIVLVLNDSAYGMIQWKARQHSPEADFGLELKNPDFAALANSFGAHGHCVTSAGELRGVLQTAIAAKGVHLIEVPVDYSHANHFPLGRAAEAGARVASRVGH
jgi:acetolactate synthase-1/2/3 large subunit